MGHGPQLLQRQLIASGCSPTDTTHDAGQCRNTTSLGLRLAVASLDRPGWLSDYLLQQLLLACIASYVIPDL
jgi:hypothetical protein